MKKMPRKWLWERWSLGDPFQRNGKETTLRLFSTCTAAAAAAVSKAGGNDTTPQLGDVNIISGQSYPKQSPWTNVSISILSKMGRNLHISPTHHPLAYLSRQIEYHLKAFDYSPGGPPVSLGGYSAMDSSSLSPVVTTQANFDDLLIGPDHPGRSTSDTYYVNQNHVLRTHTSAHQDHVLRSHTSNQYLLSADVYRRDEIDRSHYPVFHQMEGISLFNAEQIQALRPWSKGSGRGSQDGLVQNSAVVLDDAALQPGHVTEDVEVVVHHLKRTLEHLMLSLFLPSSLLNQNGGQDELQIRWIPAYFPFTSPSFEMEVLYQGQWLELCGCGVMRQEILNRTGHSGKLGWAFGLGLERIAMKLFDIPDIRLFWSKDPRFLAQFERLSPGPTTKPLPKFKPFSKYAVCYKDISFWILGEGDAFHENDLHEVVRDVAGDVVERVELLDSFTHPKTGRSSRCYRLHYRHMDRMCLNAEIDALQDKVRARMSEWKGIELR